MTESIRAGISRYYEALQQKDAEVKVPTLIVAGDEDAPQILEIADMLEQGITNAKKVIIPGTAHHLNMEKPEEFNRAVLDFLKSNGKK